MPEIGIYLEMLNHMAINRFGKVSICVRFDPKGLGIVGDVTVEETLEVYKKALENGVDKYVKPPFIKPVFRKYN